MWLFSEWKKRTKRCLCNLFGPPIGKGCEEIGADRLRKALGKDSELALTVTLNLRNFAEKPETLGRWLKESDVATVVDRSRLSWMFCLRLTKME